MQEVEQGHENAGRSSRPSAFLKKTESKQQKKVCFDPTVIDNEWKMKSRPKKMSSVAAANISIKIDSPSPKPQESRSRLPQMPGHYLEYEQVGRPSQRPLTSHPQEPVHHPVQSPNVISSPTKLRKSHQSQIPAKRPANSAAKRNKDPRTLKSTHVPPRVPDAPVSQAQKPPPTPRPTRLPTPDLIDIDGKFFCECDIRTCEEGYDPIGRSYLTKMDAQRMMLPSKILTQLTRIVEAAKAHIKNRKR